MQLEIKKDVFSQNRKLIINAEFVEYENLNFESNQSTRFLKGEIVGFRFGVEFIYGYSFCIGRTYCIDIKDIDEKIIKIRMTSIYRVNKKLLYEKFNKIIDAFFTLIK